MMTKEELQYYIDENWREEMKAHGFSPYIRNQNFWYKIVNNEVLLSLIFFSPGWRLIDLRFGMTLLCDKPSPVPFQRRTLHFLENKDGTTLFEMDQELRNRNEHYNLGLPLKWYNYEPDMFSERIYPQTRWYFRAAFDYLLWPTFEEITDAESCYAQYCEIASLGRFPSTSELTRSFAECAYLGMFDSCKKMVEEPKGTREFFERYWEDQNWRYLDGVKGPDDAKAKRLYEELRQKVNSVVSVDAFEAYRQHLRDVTAKENIRIRKLLLMDGNTGNDAVC